MDDVLGYERSFKDDGVNNTMSGEFSTVPPSSLDTARKNQVPAATEKREVPFHAQKDKKLPNVRLKKTVNQYKDPKLIWSNEYTSEMGKEILEEIMANPKAFRMGDIFFKI